MRYDAVFLYADSEHPHYDQYSLPQCPVSNEELEEFLFLRCPIFTVIEIHTMYMRTYPNYWTCLEDGTAGWWIYPVPYSGGNELFTVDITDGEVKSFIVDNGNIRFDRVLEWTLPMFGENNEISIFEWQAA